MSSPNGGIRLSALLAVTTCLALALPNVAFASTTKGSPQPELKPFTIGSSDKGSAAAFEPNGSMVVAYDSPGGTGGHLEVCMLDRGASACSHTTTITPASDNGAADVGGTPEVFVTSANHVLVLQADSGAGDLLYSSTDGGMTFGAPVVIGYLGVSSAALIGDNLVYSSGGTVFASVSVSEPAVPASNVTVPNGGTNNGVGSYQGGALLATGGYTADNNYETFVYYAPQGSDFDSLSSYQLVASLPDEYFIGISGGALLTSATTGKESWEVHEFDGTSFGAGQVVPGFEGTDGNYDVVINQDPSGAVHVFAAPDPGPGFLETSTTNGSSWSAPENLGVGVGSDNAALDAQGSGVVVGTDGSTLKETVYPILAHQSVSFTLSKITKQEHGKTVVTGFKGKGTGHVAASGRKITLERLSGGLWHSVTTTTESASGAFSFTENNLSSGSYTYRAVASMFAGYVQYGYSPARKITIS